MTREGNPDAGPSTEADRIREAYARRASTGADDRYSLDDPANRYLFSRRDQAVLKLLDDHGLLPLERTRILDIGCGNGSVLNEFARFGASMNICAGIDMLDDRVAGAREALPDADVRSGSADELPWPDGAFELALQFTLVSSVLDNATRRRIADETIRVLTPEGALLYYDFIWNPGNPDTRGLRLNDLRDLYPACTIDARRITLAPPLSRALARWSPAACRALEAAPSPAKPLSRASDEDVSRRRMRVSPRSRRTC